MIRLIVVALAALYAIFHVFGDESRRVEDVARAEPLAVNLIQAAYLPDTDVPDAPVVSTSSISDAEAIRIALEAGAEARAARKAAPMWGNEIATINDEAIAKTVAEVVAAPVYWTVTGSRVNLRSGPSTTDAVVGQLTAGAEAEVLADADGWYQIRTPDGGTSGWIFGKFLQPG